MNTNFVRHIEYKELESEVLGAEDIPMIFKPGEKIKLRVGITEGKYTVELVMPWGSSFQIGEYASEQEARNHYETYLSQLKEDYGIHVISNGKVEII